VLGLYEGSWPPGKGEMWGTKPPARTCNCLFYLLLYRWQHRSAISRFTELLRSPRCCMLQRRREIRRCRTRNALARLHVIRTSSLQLESLSASSSSASRSVLSMAHASVATSMMESATITRSPIIHARCAGRRPETTTTATAITAEQKRLDSGLALRLM